MPRSFEHYQKPIRLAEYHFDRSVSKEVYGEHFLEVLSAINAVVIKYGNMEGNCCYWHGTEIARGQLPVDSLGSARRNIWRVARFKSVMLEIGFNAGHSALIALSSNPRMFYVGLDIAINRYVEECAAIMQDAFPGRFVLVKGDSRETVPRLEKLLPEVKYDFIHIDGGHTAEQCRLDIQNCLALPLRANSHMLIDDVNAEWIFDCISQFTLDGPLATESIYGDMDDARRSLLARIITGR